MELRTCQCARPHCTVMRESEEWEPTPKHHRRNPNAKCGFVEPCLTDDEQGRMNNHMRGENTRIGRRANALLPLLLSLSTSTSVLPLQGLEQRSLCSTFVLDICVCVEILCLFLTCKRKVFSYSQGKNRSLLPCLLSYAVLSLVLWAPQIRHLNAPHLTINKSASTRGSATSPRTLFKERCYPTPLVLIFFLRSGYRHVRVAIFHEDISPR